MNAQLNTTEAYVNGLSRLTTLYYQNEFQSFISATPDMLTPIETPETLFSGLTEFPQEIFTRLNITDLIFGDKPELKISSDLVAEVKGHQNVDGSFTFWNEPSFPADIDDTAFGLAILIEAGEANLNLAHQVVDRILGNVNEDGIIRIFFPPFGHRSYIDPVVCVNALYLIALLGREQEAQKTEDYVFEHLRSKDYLEVIVNYPSPDIFLYFLVRLIKKFAYYRNRFEDHIRQALKSRIGTTNLPIELAARVIASNTVGISNEIDKDRLILSQNDCGGWPANTFFNLHRRNGFFGCEALTTAFAVKALETPRLYEQALSHYKYSNFFGVYDEEFIWETMMQVEVGQ